MKLWQQLIEQTGCQEAADPPAGYGKMYLLPVPAFGSLEPSAWMIGKYRDQKNLARNLRKDQALQDFVTFNRVRFGLRETDRPPGVGVAQQKEFGDTVQGEQYALSQLKKRLQALARPIGSNASQTNRRTDREANVLTFWQTQTPQSHHIVEFNHQRDIRASKEGGATEMDKQQLPCVLLAAEFHQFYLTQILLPTRGQGENQLRASLPEIYKGLYTRRGPLFEPLWQVSKIILRAAGLSVP